MPERRQLTRKEKRFVWSFAVVVVALMVASDAISRWGGESYAVDVATWVRAFLAGLVLVLLLLYSVLFGLGTILKISDRPPRR